MHMAHATLPLKLRSRAACARPWASPGLVSTSTSKPRSPLPPLHAWGGAHAHGRHRAFAFGRPFVFAFALALALAMASLSCF